MFLKSYRASYSAFRSTPLSGAFGRSGIDAAQLAHLRPRQVSLQAAGQLASQEFEAPMVETELGKLNALVCTWRLLCSSLLVVTCFLLLIVMISNIPIITIIGGYNRRPKKELRCSLQVATTPTDSES